MSYIDMIPSIRDRFEKRSYNYNARDFDSDTVRFLLVATELPIQRKQYLKFFKIIDDANAWGIAALRMNANDYVVATPITPTKNWITVLHGFWMVADDEAATVFILKYKTAIVMNINKTTMKNYFMSAAIILEMYNEKIGSANIDFMKVLSEVTAIKDARGQYAKKRYV